MQQSALLYEQVALTGKALASPKRLELLDILSQGEKSVEKLARELSIDIRLASAHLRVLREARLVCSRREGRHVVYALSGADVVTLWLQLREVAQAHISELHHSLEAMLSSPDRLVPVDHQSLLDKARCGDVVVIDVRPADEYGAGHLPYARSMPLAELESRIGELPRHREIIAYCRGPFCVLSDQAVALLGARGFCVRKISDGVNEWQAAGLPLAR